MNEYDVIVVGAGAAGLMCAAVAGRRGRRVLVLESSNKIAKKILISGGGRCNFTNLHCEPGDYLSANLNFCISALNRFNQWDFIALVEKHGIAYHEKGAGQLFCDNSSKDIVDMLATECRQAGVRIVTHASIEQVTRGAAFNVTSNVGTFSAGALVIATGGLSFPKMGASDFGYRLARQFGLAVRETRAGLVPLVFSGPSHALMARLAGVSLLAELTTAGVSFTENILFTHRGLSGPAALQLSNYWQPSQAIYLDLLPGQDAPATLLAAKAAQPRALLRTVLGECLPRALILELQALLWPGVADTRLAEIADELLRALGGSLQRWQLQPAGTEGYRTAEVTLGGIDTAALSSRTMAVKNQPGVYCVGEVVDVTGRLGGFNFQWAWASGWAAGEAV